MAQQHSLGSTAKSKFDSPHFNFVRASIYIYMSIYLYTHAHPILFTEEPGTAFSGSNKTPGLDCTKAPKLKVKLRSNVDTSSAHEPEEIHLLSRNG